jgi:hypothetical protein
VATTGEVSVLGYSNAAFLPFVGRIKIKRGARLLCLAAAIETWELRNPKKKWKKY